MFHAPTTLIVKLAIAFFASLAGMQYATAAATWIEGYERADGTYVEPHYLFHSNGKFYDRERLSNTITYDDTPVDPKDIPANAKPNYKGTD